MSDIENINIQAENVSVVIATLGGESLKDTIDALNLSTVIPDEILICIPHGESKEHCPLDDNVKIIETNDRGQVKQRIAGFKVASCDYVMQLDDDILVEKNCLKYLLEAVKLNDSKVAVAPSLIDTATNSSVYKKNNKYPLISSFYHWLMNGKSGYQSGKIDKTGTPVGYYIENEEIGLLESEWLAGGCVMHHKANLVLENYFPFKGKAFGEDVMHSLKLREMGVKLYIQPKSKCYLDLVAMTESTFFEFLCNLKSEIKIRKYYMKSITGESFRINIYYFITVIRYLIKKSLSF